MDQIKKDSVAVEIFNAVRSVNIFGKSDDSFVHRFAYKYTVFILIICLLMHSYSLIAKDKDKDFTSIYCIYPNEISTDEAKLFSKMYCWSSNTYYIPSDSSLPQKGEARNYRITYYQWVPWILIISSVFITAPFKTWHYLTKSYYFDLEHIMTLVDVAKRERNNQVKGNQGKDNQGKDNQGKDNQGKDNQEKDNQGKDNQEKDNQGKDNQGKNKEVPFGKNVENIIKVIGKSMKVYHESRKNLNPFRRWLNSYYLIISYIITRILYLATTFSLFWFLNILLGQNFYGLYGFKVVRDIINGKNNAVESPFFPRITMCDVPIRSTGHNINWYVVQCALPINFFNEKIFIILWFWNGFIFVGTVISTLLWFRTNFCSNKAFIKSYLQLNRKSKAESKALQSFMTQYLTHDVIFILHIIRKKGTYEIINKTILSLWESYQKIYKSTGDDYEQNLTP
jgi:hypothetical protein